jgi:hypothetical protein
MIETPNGEVPQALAREASPGKLWSVDRRRLVDVESTVGAWELNLYCARAYGLADAALWYEDQGLRDLTPLARLDALQGIRQLVIMLPILADLYDFLGLPTTSHSEQYGGVNMWRIVEHGTGRVLRQFDSTEDWRDLAFELDTRYLVPAGIDVYAEPTGLAQVPVAWVLIALVTSVVTVSLVVAWSIGKVTDYMALAAEGLQSRIQCFDRWAEEYRTTGSEEARQAMLLCHEQAIEVSQRKGLGNLLWPALLVGGILAARSLSRD